MDPNDRNDIQDDDFKDENLNNGKEDAAKEGHEVNQIDDRERLQEDDTNEQNKL